MSDPQAIQPRKRSDLLCRELDGEGILFDPRTNTTHALNVTSLLTWNQCDGAHTAREIARSLCKQFDVTMEQAERDVGLILAKFREQGLLETSS